MLLNQDADNHGADCLPSPQQDANWTHAVFFLLSLKPAYPGWTRVPLASDRTIVHQE